MGGFPSSFSIHSLVSVKIWQGEDYPARDARQDPAFELLQSEAKNTAPLSKAKHGKHTKLFSQLFRTQNLSYYDWTHK